MDTSITYTFSFAIDDKNYSFNVTGVETKAEAMEVLRKDLQVMLLKTGGVRKKAK